MAKRGLSLEEEEVKLLRPSEAFGTMILAEITTVLQISVRASIWHRGYLRD